MSVKALMKYMGQTGTIKLFKGLEVKVTVVDVRKEYGKVQYEVVPVSGGYATVWKDYVKFDDASLVAA